MSVDWPPMLISGAVKRTFFHQVTVVHYLKKVAQSKIEAKVYYLNLKKIVFDKRWSSIYKYWWCSISYAYTACLKKGIN